MITTTTFELLTLSNKNVRKMRDERFIAELAENILEYGVLQNLVVSQIGGLFMVEAGGNRFRALEKLIGEGRIPADYPIPISIVDGRQSEVSLSENVMRQAMNPIEESEAFAQLFRDLGMSVNAIAEKFGKSPMFVKQRMKLADVHPELKTRFLAGTLPLSSLLAFTVTDDQERQLAVFRECGREDPHPSAIKRALVGEAVADSDKLARFVTVEAYEAAGGEVARDLFSETCYLQDTALLERLAQEKLLAHVDGSGWKWVKAETRRDWTFLHDCGRVTLVATERTQQLEQELEVLREQVDHRLAESEDPDSDDALAELEAAIEDKEAEVEASLEVSDGDRARGGVYVSLDHQGEVDVVKGLISPQDMKALEQQAKAEQTQDNEKGPVEKKAKFSQALVDDLQCYRLAAVKAELCDNFAAAFDLVVYQMLTRQMHQYFESLLSVSVTDTFAETSRGDVVDSQDAKKLNEKKQALVGELGAVNGSAQLWEAVVAMPQKSKKALFAVLVSQSLVKPSGKLNDGLFGELEKRLKLSLRDHWSPTADNLFSRVTSDTLCRWIGELSSEQVIVGAEKKKVLVEKMAGLMGNGSEASGAWLPEVLVG